MAGTPLPNVGSHPNIAPNNRISIMAIQKLGAAMPSTANNLPKRSRALSRFTADRMPKGMPTTIVNTIAAPANCKVAGKTPKSSDLADSPVIKETPKSNRTTRPKNSAYWTIRDCHEIISSIEQRNAG